MTVYKKSAKKEVEAKIKKNIIYNVSTIVK